MPIISESPGPIPSPISFSLIRYISLIWLLIIGRNIISINLRGRDINK